MSHNDHQLT